MLSDLTVDDLDQSILDKCVLFSHNRDVDGKEIMVFDVSKHSKGKNSEVSKKIFLY